MLISGLLVFLATSSIVFDRVSAQFYVDIEHSMPRIGKRNPPHQLTSKAIDLNLRNHGLKNYQHLMLDDEALTNEAIELLHELFNSVANKNTDHGQSGRSIKFLRSNMNSGIDFSPLKMLTATDDDGATKNFAISSNSDTLVDFDTARLIKILRNKPRQSE